MVRALQCLSWRTLEYERNEIMKAQAEKNIGTFLASYRIGTEAIGGVTFTIHLVVNAPEQTLSGTGTIFQPISPPLDISTERRGDFTYIATMKDTHILVVLTGYPSAKWPPHGGIGPVLLPNVHLRMVLSDNWERGTANYEYVQDGEWVKHESVPVVAIRGEAISASA